MIVPLQKSLRILHAVSTPHDSPLRRLSPVPKVTFCILFLGVTVSFGRYDWAGCVLFAAVPFLAARIGRIPVTTVLKRSCAALPFVLCAGIANCFFDRTPIELCSGFRLSGGLVSLAVLFAKTFATVGMVLVLAAATPMNEIAGALRRLRVPCVLILQLQLLFRYLVLVIEEARKVTGAYLLRRPDCRIVPVRDWGALVGRLFLRTVSRADAIYAAMQCRLFHAGNPLPAAAGGSRCEWAGVLFLTAAFAWLRWQL